MKTNPFSFTSTAEGKSFCGRRNQVERIAHNLAQWSGASHAIIGGLHMGKSSLLRAIEVELHMRLDQEPGTAPRVLPIYISLHAFPGAASPQDVLGFFHFRIIQSLSGPASPSVLKDRPEIMSTLKSYAHAGQTPSTLQELEASLGKIITLLDPVLGPTRIALLVESVEVAAETSWVNPFFDNLNALVHDGEWRNHVRLVLTGAERLLAIKQKGSPLLTRLLLHFLEPLLEDEVQALLAMTPGLSQEAGVEITIQAGGHPFVLQYLLHYLWESGANPVTPETVATEAQRFVNDRSPDLEHWWSSIGEDGQRVYCSLRQADDWTPRSQIIKALGPQSEEALKRLIYYGLVRHNGSFKQYRTAGRLFSDWCESRCVASPALATPQKSSVPSHNEEALPNQSDAEVVTAPSYALVMKGGGVKGLAYVGALKELEKYYSFNWFVGTSAGAIAAALLAAGYTTSELEKILRDKNFKEFLDAPVYKWPSNLYWYKGLFQARTFTSWIAKLIAEKLDSPVQVLLRDLPQRLTIYASTRGEKSLVFDSFDEKTADVPVAHAVRSSMAIPYFFTPEYRNGARVVDGGVQNNFPVEALLSSHPGVKFVGLYLGPAIHEEEEKEPSLLRDLFSIWLNAADLEALRAHRDKTVIIDPRPISTTDFNLSEEEKSFLLKAGKAAALKFIHKYNSAKSASALTQHEVVEVQDEVAQSRAVVTSIRTRRKRRLFISILIGVLVFGALLFASWYWL